MLPPTPMLSSDIIDTPLLLLFISTTSLRTAPAAAVERQ